MVRKVAFTVIPSTDAQRSRAFYEGLLGLTPGSDGAHGGMFWIEYDLPEGGCVAVSNATPARPSAVAGSTIALEVEDLDALIAHLRAHEVSLLGQVVKGPHCRMQTCLDPDGNSLILHQLDR